MNSDIKVKPYLWVTIMIYLVISLPARLHVYYIVLQWLYLGNHDEVTIDEVTMDKGK